MRKASNLHNKMRICSKKCEKIRINCVLLIKYLEFDSRTGYDEAEQINSRRRIMSMKSMKKAAGFLLALCMVLTMLPAAAFAAWSDA